MPSAPDPVTSPPDVPGQPYDATDSGGSIGKWRKVPDGGASEGFGEAHGEWPGNGDSDGGDWKQT